MTTSPLFDGQRALLDQLLQRRDRLAHGMLLAGPAGVGKSRFAAALAQALVCERLADQSPLAACGACPACQWVEAGHHPDVKMIGLEVPGEDKPASEIGIDRIRALDEFARLSPFRGGRRVIVIDPADALNTASANALLKLLEEPGPATFLLLVTARADRLPATIRSRTQRQEVPAPARSEAIAWLSAQGSLGAAQAATVLDWTGGAPLQALALADPAVLTAHRGWLAAIARLPETPLVVVADQFATADMVTGHGLLSRWVSDLARVKAGAKPRFFPDAAERLGELARRCPAVRLMQAQQRLQEQSALVRHPLNPRLFLEQILLGYLDAFATQGSATR